MSPLKKIIRYDKCVDVVGTNLHLLSASAQTGELVGVTPVLVRLEDGKVHARYVVFASSYLGLNGSFLQEFL